jgi:hypothetical protein
MQTKLNAPALTSIEIYSYTRRVIIHVYNVLQGSLLYAIAILGHSFFLELLIPNLKAGLGTNGKKNNNVA